MAWVLPLLILLAYCSGFGSEAVLTQSGPMQVSPGELVSITCRIQGVELISSTNPSWYHQAPETAPRLLIYNCRERHSGVPDRFLGEVFGHTARLTIAKTQEEDEGDYYCVAWTEDAWHSGQVRWRNETKSCLTLSLPPSLPRQPLLPSDSHQTSDALLRTVFAKPGGARETPASPYFSDEAPVTFGVQAQSTPGKASLEVAAHIPLKVRVVWQFHIVFILLMAWLFSFQGRWLTSSSPSFL
uniref:Ig-like domain-containing protein n=1 Tax=Varanus komodoensis TaxID=61221 RepID=A0A8D2JDG6_VARKO